MEKSAKTIGRRKFGTLSSARQHKLLAALAQDVQSVADYPAFQARYNELHNWASLDRYQPPSWLSPLEAARACEAFHKARAGATVKTRAANPTPLPWEARFPVQVALDHVRAPYNLGSVLRLVDNTGFAGIIQGRPWHDLQHPQLRRAARGCQDWIPVNQVEDLHACLTASELPLIALEAGDDAIPLHQWQPPRACIILAGNETYGIAEALLDLCQQRVEIPMFGYKHSLNVHQALAVAAYHYIQVHG